MNPRRRRLSTERASGPRPVPRVLVVDPDPYICELLRALLEELHAQVFTTATAHDARAVVEQEAMDVAIIEVMLPDGTGVDLARELVRGGAEPILVSGHEDGTRAGMASPFPFLRKPFGTKDLLRQVVQLLPE